jgi:hypothetical protein
VSVITWARALAVIGVLQLAVHICEPGQGRSSMRAAKASVSCCKHAGCSVGHKQPGHCSTVEVHLGHTSVTCWTATCWRVPAVHDITLKAQTCLPRLHGCSSGPSGMLALPASMPVQAVYCCFAAHNTRCVSVHPGTPAKSRCIRPTRSAARWLTVPYSTIWSQPGR